MGAGRETAGLATGAAGANGAGSGDADAPWLAAGPVDAGGWDAFKDADMAASFSLYAASSTRYSSSSWARAVSDSSSSVSWSAVNPEALVGSAARAASCAAAAAASDACSTVRTPNTPMRPAHAATDSPTAHTRSDVRCCLSGGRGLVIVVVRLGLNPADALIDAFVVVLVLALVLVALVLCTGLTRTGLTRGRSALGGRWLLGSRLTRDGKSCQRSSRRSRGTS